MHTDDLPLLFFPNRLQLKGPDAYPLHDHEFGEIFWIDSGTCTHFINNRTQQLQMGDCGFIRPHDIHAYSSKSAFHIANVSFQWPILEDILTRHFPAGSDPYGTHHPFPKIIRLKPGQLSWIRQIFFKISKAPCLLFHIELYLMEILSELLPLPEPVSFFAKETPFWMQRAWHRMREPVMLQEGIPAFRRLCGRSAEHVSREFHRFTGKTLSSSINRLRIEQAAALLSSTDQEIIDIAMNCGFESISHFYSSFKRHFKSSPLVYRKQHHQKLRRLHREAP